MNHLFRKFRRDIIGLIWLALGLFLALALMSYHPTDPSFNAIGRAAKVANYCGYFGSFLADFLYQLLGVSAWILVIASFRKAIMSFLGHDSLGGRLRWLWAVLLFLTSCSLIALYFPETRLFAEQIPSGGLVGLLVSKGLVRVFNFAGVAVILWTAAAVLMVFYTERTISDLLRSPISIFQSYADRLVGEEGAIVRFGAWLKSQFKKLTAKPVESEIPIKNYQAGGAEKPNSSRFMLREKLGKAKVADSDGFIPLFEDDEFEE